MKLQQLRYVSQVVKSGLNVSLAADQLFTSQPGVSKQIRLLEDELGVDIFVRHGKRLVEVTDAGRTIIALAERVLAEAENLKRAGSEFNRETSGSLTIATTHTQARYALPPAVTRFMERYPDVRLVIHQGSPKQIAQQVVDGQADLVIATESIADNEALVTLPCYQWNRCVVVPPRHPLLKVNPLTLEAITRYPIITYDFAFAGRTAMQRAFEKKGLTPNVVLAAIDSDVIKTYTALGLGVGIVADIAFNAEEDRNLKALSAAHLFEPSWTRLGIRKNTFLRSYVYDFIEMFAPKLTRKAVEAAMRGEGSGYEL